MFHVHTTGWITTIGRKEDKKTYYNIQAGDGYFVNFRVVSRRYQNGETKWESMNCKRYIKGNPEKFCKLLEEKTMISITGILEIYYSKKDRKTYHSISCQNVDICGKSTEIIDNNEETNDESTGHFDS